MATFSSFRSSVFRTSFLFILALTVTGGFLFYNHVQNREEYLNHRNFRHLSQIAFNFESALETYRNVLATAFESPPGEFPPDGDLDKYNYSSPENIADCQEKVGFKTRINGWKKFISFHNFMLKKIVPSLCGINKLEPIEIRVENYFDLNSPVEREGMMRLVLPQSAEASRKGWRLEFKKVFNPICKDCPPGLIHFLGDLNVGTMLDDQIFSDVFATVILADEQGKVFYQTSDDRYSLPMRLERIDKIFDSRDINRGSLENSQSKPVKDNRDGNKEPPKNSSFLAELPAVRTLSLGETTYRVFAQAAVIPACKLENTEDCHLPKMMILGFVPNNKFRMEAWAVPDEALILLLASLLIGGLSLPLVKLLTVGPGDHLGLPDALGVMFCSLAGTALLTLMLLDYFLVSNAKEVWHKSLNVGANQIKTSFESELDLILKQIEQVKDDNRWCKGSTSKNQKIHCVNLLEKNPHLIEQYPYTTTLISIDGNGHLKNIASVKAEAVYGANLAKRGYFQRAMRDDLWEYQPSSSKKAVRFTIEPIYAWDDGRYGAMVATPKTRIDDNCSGNDDCSKVVAMRVPFFSLTDTALPPGFGYAVINQDGKVMFHSERKRNLRENFLRETDDNPQLHGILYHGNDRFVHGNYYGTDHEFYVTNLHSALPWKLIAFRDKTWGRTANLEILFFAGVLFFLYTIVVLGIGLFGLLIFGTVSQGKGGWMWPQEIKHQNYRFIWIWNFVFLVVFLLFLFGASYMTSKGDNLHILILLLGIILPIVAMVFMMWQLMRQEKKDDRDVRLTITPSCRFQYVFMVMSFMLLYAAVPASAFFFVGAQEEIKNYLSHEAHEFSGRTDGRYKTIGRYYQGIKISTNFRTQMFKNLTDFQNTKSANIPSIKKSTKTQSDDLKNSPNDLQSEPANWSILDPLSNGLKLTGLYHAFLPQEIKYLIGIPKSANKSDDANKLGTNPLAWQDFRRSWLRLWHNPIAEKLGGHFKQFSINHDFPITVLDLSQYPPEDFKHTFQLGFSWPDMSNTVLFMSIQLIAGVIIVWRYAKWWELKSQWAWKAPIYLFIALLIIVLTAYNFRISFIGFPFIGLMIILGLTYAFPRMISRRLFLLDLDYQEEERNSGMLTTSQPGIEGKQILLLLPSNTNARAFLQTLELTPQKRIQIHFTDTQAVRLAWSSLATAKEESVAFLEFEYRLGDAYIDQQKLELLEHAFLSNRQILIVSCQDPLDYKLTAAKNLESNGTPKSGASIDRWIWIFSSFVVVHSTQNDSGFKLPAKLLEYLKNPNDSNSRVLWQNWVKERNGPALKFQDEKTIASTLQLNRYRYEGLWAFLPEPEKLALWHLAKDHFLHADNPALPSLLRKSLVLLDPDLRLMSEPFRRFVIKVAQREGISVIEKRVPTSWWSRISGPLSILVVGGAVFLGATQAHVREVLVAFIPIIPVLLTAVPRIFGMFQGTRAESPG